MNDPVQCFRYDHWSSVPAMELLEGDLILHAKRLIYVTASPYVKDGKPHIPGEVRNPGPIQIDISSGYLARAMDFVGSDLQVFDDGTALITDFDHAPGFVYSPRLPKDELEAFCERHIDQYRAFYEANAAEIDTCNCVPLVPWWSAADEVSPR
ncbi:hypothetical protein [Pseudomonas reactans]|uniref:hypothetical protein n=1 Tax=Pseudomonas reactans TaxID=117680 RepID=UPI0015A37F08|nr:hypothetical protein [Pseudomonas reactans]NWC90011.1 hypothetical protein [Pseudomonas reactans]